MVVVGVEPAVEAEAPVEGNPETNAAVRYPACRECATAVFTERGSANPPLSRNPCPRR
jgi:hypothetical protein